MKIKLSGFVLILSIFFLVLAGCESQGGRSIIVVSGIGTVMAQPDTVQMMISLNKTAETTRRAQEEVSAMVKKTLQILEGAGIESRYISTASLRFSPEYDWGGSRRILLGQKAEQIISFSAVINNNDTSESNRVSNIIDQLIQIDGIELQQMNFTVRETGQLFIRSRELAYQKALEKAEQYASLSGMKIIRTVSITEDGASQAIPIMNRAVNNSMVTFAENQGAASGSTVLPSGEMEITSRISVEFLLK